jgi:hypothetical protein
VRVAVRARFVNGYDVGVQHPSGRLGLASKAFDRLRRADRLRPQQFQGNVTFQVRVEGPVDGAERPGAEPPPDAVLADRRQTVRSGRVRGGRQRHERPAATRTADELTHRAVPDQTWGGATGMRTTDGGHDEFLRAARSNDCLSTQAGGKGKKSVNAADQADGRDSSVVVRVQPPVIAPQHVPARKLSRGPALPSRPASRPLLPQR